MATYPKPFENLLESLRRFPGIGAHSAERLAFFLIKDQGAAQEIATSILDAKKVLKRCSRCFTVSEHEVCPICSDESRDQTRVCVVETPRDLQAIEATGVWKGIYHCLTGRISPSENIRENDLTISALVSRVKKEGLSEIMLATNPDLAGDATAMAVSRALSGMKVPVTRPARGVPIGHNLNMLSGAVLEEAIGARAPLPAEGGEA